MTHAVHSHWDPLSQDPVDLRYPRRKATKDLPTKLDVPLSSGGYEWRNIFWLKDSVGWNNAGEI